MKYVQIIKLSGKMVFVAILIFVFSYHSSNASSYPWGVLSTGVPATQPPGAPAMYSTLTVRGNTLPGVTPASSLNLSQADFDLWVVKALGSGGPANSFEPFIHSAVSWSTPDPTIAETGKYSWLGHITPPGVLFTLGSIAQVTKQGQQFRTCSGGTSWAGWTMNSISGQVYATFDPGYCFTTPPEIVLTANPPIIDKGSSSRLIWTATDAVSCGNVGIVGSINSVPTESYVNLPANGYIDVSPADDTFYSAFCSNAFVSSYATVTVRPVNASLPGATLTALPTSISSGQSSTLTYACTNATSASIDNGVGTLATPASGTVPVTPSTTTTYTLICTNATGSATANATVTVTPAIQPDLTASTVSPTTATVGTAVTLSSTISNNGSASTGAGFTNLFQRATNAFGSGATDIGTYTSTALGVSGSNTASLSYTFPSAGTFYVRACADKSSAGSSGTITESNEGNNCGAWTAITVSASVAPAPICTFSANPTSSVPSTLTWSSTNATSCTGGGFSTGNATSGNTTVSTAGTYTLSCTGAGGSCTQPLTIGGACSGTKTGTITATPARVRSGTNTTLTVSNVTNVQTSCIVSGPGVSQTISANSCTVTGTTIPTPAIVTQSTYLLICDGTEVSRVVVNVLPNFVEF